MFDIKSYKGEYHVEFVDYIPTLSHEGNIFVIDDNIWDQYYRDKHIENNEVFLVHATEDAKTLRESQRLIDFLIENEFRKNNKIIAVGGGVVQDLVAFTTSILYRGVDWEFYPTTLLAQCDSCIGSKTSINHNKFKNLLGGFHPPRNIYINIEFLNTLPEDDIKSGVGEMLHYFLLNHEVDLSEEMVDDEDIIGNINKYLTKSLSIKKEMIEKDEFDRGRRNLFNYGHTFGHAIETLSDYSVNHGQAVTMGIKIANTISINRKMINNILRDKIDTILIKNMPDYIIEDVDQYIECLKRDKKNVSNKLTCILLTQEYADKIEIYYDEVKGALDECF